MQTSPTPIDVHIRFMQDSEASLATIQTAAVSFSLRNGDNEDISTSNISYM